MEGHQVAGMLLCHAGTHRLAFAAQEVAIIDVPQLHPGRVRSARLAFGEPTGAARVLLAPSGEVVGVDALEIEAEAHHVLPAPGVLARVAGGSLKGFIMVHGVLWPLMRLVDFERFLEKLAGEAA